MKSSSFLQLVLAAGAITAVVTLVVAPKLREAEKAPPAATAVETVTTPSSTAPAKSDIPYGHTAMLKREKDGHYWALAGLDGQYIRLMVDTGASVVALTMDDAKKVGIDTRTLDFSWPIRTAGGEVMGASVMIGEIKIAGVKVENVEAMVLRDGLQQSLLGMSFLGQLYSYEFRGENLILRK